MNNIITGAVAGIVGDKTGEALYGKSHLDEHGECVHMDIHKMLACLEHMTSVSPRPPVYQRVTLQPGALVGMGNETHDRYYNVAFVNTATQVVFEIIGQGQSTMTLAAGWNLMNMPEFTNWGLPSSATGNVNVLYCASDVMFGAAIHG